MVALSLYVASYYAEILRAGIQSIRRRAKSDAALCGLGMSDQGQAMRRVILPQALRQDDPAALRGRRSSR